MSECAQTTAPLHPTPLYATATPPVATPTAPHVFDAHFLPDPTHPPAPDRVFAECTKRPSLYLCILLATRAAVRCTTALRLLKDTNAFRCCVFRVVAAAARRAMNLHLHHTTGIPYLPWSLSYSALGCWTYFLTILLSSVADFFSLTCKGIWSTIHHHVVPSRRGGAAARPGDGGGGEGSRKGKQIRQARGQLVGSHLLFCSIFSEAQSFCGFFVRPVHNSSIRPHTPSTGDSKHAGRPAHTRPRTGEAGGGENACVYSQRALVCKAPAAPQLLHGS